MANEKRLIDANALFKAIKSHKIAWRFGVPNTLELMFDWLRLIIKEQPTVDAVEVVHGRWIFGTANHREWMKCSVCLKSQTPTGVFTYCPNCGAKMDGGNEDA